MYNFSSIAGNIWNGWWDELKEGEMISVSSGKPLNQSFAPWDNGEPNGDIKENCGILRKNRTDKYKAVWNDISCSRPACVACDIPLTPVFVLRGTCNLTSIFST